MQFADQTQYAVRVFRGFPFYLLDELVVHGDPSAVELREFFHTLKEAGKMIHIKKGFIVLLAGLMVTLTAGCISGPRTFSSTQVPVTKYVSFEERPVPVFDIPSASQNSDMSLTKEVDCANGQVVSLQP